MAGRPTKQGIDYFPLDVDFFSNTKVRKIAKACGPQAASILVCLLCNIYQKQGYYILWDDDVPFVIADLVGVTEGLVIEVVKKALQVNFFDQGKFDQHHILTSDGIQRRYGIAVYQRKEISFNSDYLTENHALRINHANNSIDCANNTEIVIKKERKPINCTNNRINHANNSINPTHNEQSINNKERTITDVIVPKKDELSLPKHPKEKENVDWEAFLDYFNKTFEGRLATVRKLTETRRTAAKARIAEYGKESVIEVYRKVLQSDFLMGENNRGWKADFDWIFTKRNYTRILEGVHDNENRKTTLSHEENRNPGTTKQEVNDYALQQYLADRQRIEEGWTDETPNPF